MNLEPDSRGNYDARILQPPVEQVLQICSNALSSLCSGSSSTRALGSEKVKSTRDTELSQYELFNTPIGTSQISRDSLSYCAMVEWLADKLASGSSFGMEVWEYIDWKRPP